MEEGIKEEPKKAEAATGQDKGASTTTTAGAMADATFKSIGDVLKLLPTATVIVYEVLNPIVTNTGDCHVANKVVTPILLALCAFFCAFSTFIDSYVGADGKVKYGLITPRGLLPFVPDNGVAGRDFSKYRLRLADFVHAAFAVTVFAAVALLADANTVACFYPALKKQQKQVVMALPVVVGAVASIVFIVFPSTRHGIGYPPAKPETGALASQ
ncbi:protein DMP2-like [Phragmites australis]|uniref:protein DMP2-like n=1 Tax=Phragmites australis TaxID=29695 RepID=UPI002D77F51A|nr:protein DMP2-like [Phragmites australis]